MPRAGPGILEIVQEMTDSPLLFHGSRDSNPQPSIGSRHAPGNGIWQWYGLASV